MPYQTITYQRKGRVGAIALNRPEAKNAINALMSQELAEVCSEISRDETAAVVTLTGTGEAFSVGTDSKETRLWPVATALAKLNCPLICAVNGDALGQGLELALACDLRVASETARLGLPQIASGLIPRDGGTQRLPRLIARAKALEMILLGEPVNAREACRLGLVNQVVAPDELSPVVAEIARKMSARAPLALRYAKEAILQGAELTLEQGLRLETDLYSLLQTTDDRTEGIRAFQEKRQPKFRGK